MYGGAYTRLAKYSGLDAYSQSLSLSVVKSLGPKWTFTLSAAGSDSTLAQYLFEPSPLGVIVQVPSTFDDLAAAFAAGQFGNVQVAALLTGTPIPQTAGRTLFLGNKVLTYTAQAGLSYAASSRLQFHVAGFAAAGQNRYGGQDGVPPSNYVMPRSIGGNAGAGFSYSLSPRTEVGGDVGAYRSLNHFQSLYGTSANAHLGRKMGLHWFLNMNGGVSYSSVLQQLEGTPRTFQVIGGGSLGFQTGGHTFVGTYMRAANDAFGFAAGSVTSMSGAWNWRHPGSRWSVFTSYGEQQTRDTGFESLSGWSASGGISTGLSSHTSLTAQYVYMDSAGNFLGNASHYVVQSVRVSVGWTPQAVDH